MQIQKINNNYNPQFKGFIKLQDLKTEKITQKRTTIDLDRGLAQVALKNLFDGNWENEGSKIVKRIKLSQYIDAISQTLGIRAPRPNKELEHVELKYLDNGYSIKSDSGYKLTHIREDQFID